MMLPLSRNILAAAISLCSIYRLVDAAAIGNFAGRERISINDGWRFLRSEKNTDGLVYDFRPDNAGLANATVLKPWILPSGNDFLANGTQFVRPAGNPGGDFAYVQTAFDDSSWQAVTLPHDWAIAGPFYTGANPPIGGGMGRLPVQGVGWYRMKLEKTAADEGRSIYLDIDGAMSYAVVWLNGYLVGGWPYGYNSFRLDLTPYFKTGVDNQLAIRLDNPVDSARWYPGAGLYRNVWLTKTDSTHVAQYGTTIRTRDVTAQSANVDLTVQVQNTANSSRQITVTTEVYILDAATGEQGDKVAEFAPTSLTVEPGQRSVANGSLVLQNPRLWGPAPAQTPNRYVALTQLVDGSNTIDTYETRFGVRSLTFDSNQGLFVNGQKVGVQGVNNHHDLGSIGSAFNTRAAERQLEILQELGCNAVRMSHNPPAPELLELTDRLGFLVFDEIFDSWYRNKTANDFYLIFPDWREQDLRALIRRDRNHPSVIVWSYGNEVGEQTLGEEGAAISQELHDIVLEEDPTRPSTSAQNAARPETPFTRVVDIISLNYQGAGIRDTNPYSGLTGITTPPSYPDYHRVYPDKLIWSSETASALSTRGSYIFPVVNETSAPVNDTSGGDSVRQQVSAYELYTANFGSSPDKVFASQDASPFVAGEFVWTGWDYIGEPTPYYGARSSYSGIIDLAGFKKDRFYLYQSRWRPDLRFAHILPHWNWPDRVGQVTPVHVFTSADQAELFINGVSQGRQSRGSSTYRFRWDEVEYQPGRVDVVTYKNGALWANATVETTGPAARLRLTADRDATTPDGADLSFITAEVVDSEGRVVPLANNTISFSVNGPGTIVATDNGDPADFTVFPSTERNAYYGLALAIVRGDSGGSGTLVLTASAEGLKGSEVSITLARPALA